MERKEKKNSRGATLPPCWQLAQEINKKFHKPLTVQNTSIINLLQTVNINYFIIFINTLLMGENL
jgi:hypothetical protein